jgi:glucose-6-phosphate isomerase
MSWKRFNEYLFTAPELSFSLDLSRMNFGDDFFASHDEAMGRAFAAMAELEKGAMANPDEKRMVGHYWLRKPDLAPSPELSQGIRKTVESIETFAANVHAGGIEGANGHFSNILLIGIGGSALGPQFVSQALGHPRRDKMRIYFFDNTDPDGMQTVLTELEPMLGCTLCVVVSKSGTTPETRNGMVEAQEAYRRAGLDFARHAVAVTGEGSQLDRLSHEEGWIRQFPMWDWVGGRTSELAAVGLLPAALQGINIREMLAGAAAMDELTRRPETRKNPAALLALMWHHATQGRGEKDMVILPYKDRLALFSKYLQQLIMESLGKELDLDGKVVNQGIAVYGNKGSTDQHAYVQQLREGVNNFFVTFIEVLRDRESGPVAVEGEFTSGDFLQGFLLGTRQALHENGRESITITIEEVTPRTVGMLIALYERAVGLYASLVNINAYHQPGVEAGKKAAASILGLKQKVIEHVRSSAGQTIRADEVAAALGQEQDAETIFKLLEHLAANGREVERVAHGSPSEIAYRFAGAVK